MGDHSTRPAHQHHQARAAFAAGLVVLLLSGVPLAASTSKDGLFPVPSPNEMPLAQGVIFNLSTAAPGQESLDVSARFTNDSNNTIQDLDWKIKNTAGEVVYSTMGERAQTQLSPGQYEVEAFYGSAHLDQGVSLPAGA